MVESLKIFFVIENVVICLMLILCKEFIEWWIRKMSMKIVEFL